MKFVIYSDCCEFCGMNKGIIKILLVEDDELVRLGIQFKLEQLDIFDFRLFTSENGKEAIDFLSSNNVDVILLDLYMDVCDGFSTLMMLNNLKITTPVIIVSSTESIIEIKQTIKLGARAFVHKSQDINSLGEAILSVLEGSEFYSIMTQKTLEAFNQKRNKYQKHKIQFSEKELLILSYLLDGYTSKEIAIYLYLSPRTVEGLRSKIMRKTETKSILELAKYVTSNNLKLIGKV